jgi:hypothetical protein
MAPKLCKYGCGTTLEGFDEENRKFLEAGTGGLHTKERCQEAKNKLAQKNDHGNEQFNSSTVNIKAPATMDGTQTATISGYVDHTAKGLSKVKIFYAVETEQLEIDYDKFLFNNQGKIKTQGAQFQMENGQFAIALYYEEVK